ncbi:UDP-N-acetylmuramoyl-L-alanine--D-glutamate ligase [Sphaerimonospora thailandensis]|uniref:UDP-N-acetylmuramoyl-L-alanine--D-glutamate ligase n=1 Tax=Sphaerimonospora thailandensis TaxID=795644 RepID=UPI00194EB7C3|nr:UDP-N-acetylmuramoyl-L-alanine--D-glutamate ligase [Sphaerimonospora thailandensis]
MGAQVVSVVVAGLGVSGTAAARALARRGEHVVVLESADGERQRAAAADLASLGVEVRFGEQDELPEGASLVVVSPGWRPDHPLAAAAHRAGVEVIGEVELAWRLRDDARGAPWLAITGTNGKTTAVRMLTAMLTAAGHRAAAVGNVGDPIVTAVTREGAAREGVAGEGAAEPYDVLAVELSSFQLHWSKSLAPLAAVVLNVAPDHIDWHGSFEEYAAAKARIYPGAQTVIYNADDEGSAALAAPYGRRVGFTLGVPRPGQLGVVEDLLVDRAFTADPVHEAAELAGLADVRPFAPHNVANALAAAALARAYGVPPEAVRRGLAEFVPDPHRIAHVATVGAVDYVDDSKATNPHAAAASLAAYRSIVWIAGGLLKGAEVDDLVRQAAPRLRGAVLLGADRERVREALARHAPDVPVVDVPGQETGIMDRVVTEAAALASPGDTVLLAPAGASLDMFTSYGARGEAFAAAVRRLAQR